MLNITRAVLPVMRARRAGHVISMLRLPLGTDTLKAIAEKNAYVTQETETWKALSASTDFSAPLPAPTAGGIDV